MEYALLEKGPYFNKHLHAYLLKQDSSPDHVCKEIRFTDQAIPPDMKTADVSADQDGSIQIWMQGQTMFVSTGKEGVGIRANSDSSYMFYEMINMEHVNVNVLDMHQVRDTSYMMFYCLKLKELDISQWDVRNLTFTECMFSCCNTSLEMKGATEAGLDDVWMAHVNYINRVNDEMEK